MAKGRKLLIWLGACLAGVAGLAVVLLGAAVLYARTDGGRQAIADQIAAALSDEAIALRIGRLAGDLPAAPEIQEIALADRNGPFMRIDRVSFRWRPLALLAGRLAVDRIELGRVSIDRPPAMPEGSAPSTDGGAAPLAIGIDIAIERLTIADLRLGEAVFGLGGRYEMGGALTHFANGTRTRLDVDLRRTDGPPARAMVAIDYAARPARFAAKAEIVEPSGGRLAGLLGIPGAPPLSLRLDGAGPPEAWQGKLTATAEPADLSADLSVRVTESGIGLGIDGTAAIAALMPPGYARLLGQRTRLAAHARVTPGQGLAIDRIRLEGEALAFDASGNYAFADGAIEGALLLESRAPLAIPVGATELGAGGLRVSARLAGTAARPEASGSVDLSALAAAPLEVAAIAGDFGLKPVDGGGTALSGDLRLRGVETGPGVPAGLIADDAALRLRGALGGDGSIAAAELSLTSGGLTLDLDGRQAYGGELEGTYRLTLAQLAPLARQAGFAADGGLQVLGGFRGDPDRLTGQVQATATLMDLQGVPQSVEALVGQAVPVTAAIERHADGRIDLIGASIGLAAGAVHGEATLAPDGRTLTEARLTLTAPDLAPLSPLIGAPLTGGGWLRADLSGPIDDLAAEIVMALDNPRVAQTGVRHLGLGLGMRWTDEGASGGVNLAIVTEDRTIPGSFRFRWAGGALRIDDLAVADGGNRLDGDFRVATGTGLIEGQARARLTDFSALPVSGLERLAGMVEIAADLGGRDGRQDIAFSGKGAALGFEGGGGALSIGAVSLAANIADAFRAPGINGTVRVSDLRAGDAELSHAQIAITAAGPNGARFEGTLDGRYGAPFEIALAGAASIATAGYRAEIERLAGKIGTVPVEASAPARIEIGTDGTWAAETALAAGAGTVTATAAYGTDTVQATLAAVGLPLAILALADPRLALDGTITGRITLDGPHDLPRGTATLSLGGIRPGDANWPEGQELSASVDARLADGRLSVDSRASGPLDTTIDLRASGPLALSLGSHGAMVMTDGPVAGNGTLDGRLDLLNTFLQLGENRVGGRVTGNFDLSGTARAPALRGTAQLSQGRYEGITTGTVIQDIEATLRLEGDALQLVALQARDGNTGRLSGSGRLGIGAAADWPLDMRVSLSEFTAIARHDAMIRASGELGLRGTALAPSVDGRITVDGGEIQIPDRLPEGIVVIDVVEANAPPAGPSGEARESPSLSQAVAIPLDFQIAIPGRVFVRGRGLDSEWSGTLAVSGTTAEPRIIGSLSVVRGTFAFAGRSFVVRAGDVRFPADGAADPEIDARAELALADIVATMQLAGSASEPRLSLVSTPPLPTDEILSRILFGKTFGQLNALQAAELAQSAAVLSGNAPGPGIIDRVRRTLGVDVLSIESQGDSAAGTALKTGKYISDDVFVTVRQGATPDSQKVGVEIEVLPNVSVETNIGPTSGSAAGINWKWDY